MSKIQQEINECIDAFVAQITELARQAAFQTLESGLGGTGRRASAKGMVSGGTRVRRKSGKRSPEEIQETANTLLEYIRENPGQRMEAIAKALNSTTKDLTLPIKKLLQGNLVRVEGQKRATSYYPASGKATRKKRRRRRS